MVVSSQQKGLPTVRGWDSLNGFMYEEHSTRRKTSLRGMPLGKDKAATRNSCSTGLVGDGRGAVNTGEDGQEGDDDHTIQGALAPQHYV